MSAVLDASVFVSAVSPAERRHALARALLDRLPPATPWLVPALFRVEVLAALARRGESAELLDLIDAIVRGPRYWAAPLDAALLDRAARVAREARLRAYDAVYVALALERGVPLCTLDAELGERAAATFPGLQVLGGA